MNVSTDNVLFTNGMAAHTKRGIGHWLYTGSMEKLKLINWPVSVEIPNQWGWALNMLSSDEFVHWSDEEEKLNTGDEGYADIAIIVGRDPKDFSEKVLRRVRHCGQFMKEFGVPVAGVLEPELDDAIAPPSYYVRLAKLAKKKQGLDDNGEDDEEGTSVKPAPIAVKTANPKALKAKAPKASKVPKPNEGKGTKRKVIYIEVPSSDDPEPVKGNAVPGPRQVKRLPAREATAHQELTHEDQPAVRPPKWARPNDFTPPTPVKYCVLPRHKDLSHAGRSNDHPTPRMPSGPPRHIPDERDINVHPAPRMPSRPRRMAVDHDGRGAPRNAPGPIRGRPLEDRRQPDTNDYAANRDTFVQGSSRGGYDSFSDVGARLPTWGAQLMGPDHPAQYMGDRRDYVAQQRVPALPDNEYNTDVWSEDRMSDEAMADYMQAHHRYY
ncbi:hypothetical protein Hypma_002978 [Hypsizygus marmoreus]|uniref:Uncharacterized protein n=1 Tax=Hypsizygus marmoreus TaxID=39966 RepID=A0A369JBW2_HYPMA|nr:hypothetical protein Hypma_002978 [Hypsizygus marmoreus]